MSSINILLSQITSMLINFICNGTCTPLNKSIAQPCFKMVAFLEIFARRKVMATLMAKRMSLI